MGPREGAEEFAKLKDLGSDFFFVFCNVNKSKMVYSYVLVMNTEVLVKHTDILVTLIHLYTDILDIMFSEKT